MHPEVCIIFDDDAEDLDHRVGIVSEALEALEYRGVNIGETCPMSSRAEVLERLSGPGRFLLVADMGSEHARGNIGARLMRSVSQREAVAGRVRRVMFSRYNVQSVTQKARPFVHAFCEFSKRSSQTPDHLYAAIRHALEFDGPAAGRVFPAAREVVDWESDIKAAVIELVGDKRAELRGYRELALGIAAVELKAVDIQNNLHRIVGDVEAWDAHNLPHPTTFANAVMDNLVVRDTDVAYERIRTRMKDVFRRTPYDMITPAICDQATKGRASLLTMPENAHAYSRDHQRYLEHTWLTAHEDDLLERFLGHYNHDLDAAHGNNDGARIGAIRKLLSSRVNHPPMPELAGSGDPDVQQHNRASLAHALWTIDDVRDRS